MSTFDFSQFDYSNGEQYMKELFMPSNMVDTSASTFLNLPLTEGYKNNAERIAEFSSITDSPESRNPMNFNIEPILTDISGNVIPIVYTEMPVEEVIIDLSQPEETSPALDSSITEETDGQTDSESVSST